MSTGQKKRAQRQRTAKDDNGHLADVDVLVLTFCVPRLFSAGFVHLTVIFLRASSVRELNRGVTPVAHSSCRAQSWQTPRRTRHCTAHESESPDARSASKADKAGSAARMADKGHQRVDRR